jgi:hypothetical protein
LFGNGSFGRLVSSSYCGTVTAVAEAATLITTAAMRAATNFNISFNRKRATADVAKSEPGARSEPDACALFNEDSRSNRVRRPTARQIPRHGRY